jgi:hypothetical protein
MADDISTIFDEAADTLRDPSSRNHIGGLSPADALGQGPGTAVKLPLELYGQEFTVIVGSRDRRGTTLTAYLFDESQDVLSQDIKLRSLDRISMKTLRTADFDDEDVQDDIEHALATIMGYFSRYLIDGRNYTGWNPTHDEPVITTE